jgi:hypothetical protein
MREGHCQAIHPEAPSLEPELAYRPPSPVYLSNNKNQDKSHPPNFLLYSFFVTISSILSDSSRRLAAPKG